MIGSVSASFPQPYDSVSLRGLANAGASNYFCDFLFDDAGLAQDGFDLLMQNLTDLFDDETPGICHNGSFVTVQFTGPDGVMAKAMNKNGHIEIHNYPQYVSDPCAS
jgi:hypothetical protein